MNDNNFQKTSWTKPEVIILIRSTPEESVLTTCKAESGAFGSGNQYSACLMGGSCGNRCDAISAS